MGSNVRQQIEAQLKQRILLIDGGMGTMIQGYKLEEQDYRGERFADWHCDLKGNNDLLVLSQPQLIKEIHSEYLEAGADILETNTFNATTIAMADYDMESLSEEINFAAAKLAREVADEWTAKTPDKPRYVAGVLGPTNRTCSISPDVNDPGYRNVSFDQLVEAYSESTRALIKGGSDLILIETIFDTLNAKACAFAVDSVFEELGGGTVIGPVLLGLKHKAQIVIGARSSLFLPFKNLGLIIVDEEHEPSFKQYDPAPRYHARDAAVVLGNISNCDVLLGSATPSVESFLNVKKEKYGYATITRRYGNVLMPEVELVDIKELTRKKRMKGHFSEKLLKGISEAVEEGEQVILFQNRRGYAPIVECTTCGHSPQCPNCDVSLTFHQYKKQLRCHYCSHATAIPESCLACGGSDLDTKGFGTEQIEEEVNKLFPEAKVGRMDLDTTRGKYAYEKIITSFEQQEMDILIGTQMITKGLDFRNVSLVGVMNADALLNFPDYRAHERTFQLLTQVSGRAGRTKKRGKVIIQTYNPYHQILKQVSTGDYDAMYQEQLYEREQYKYPPTNRIIKITFKHKNYNVLNEASEWFCGALKNAIRATVLGPEYPPVTRIRNQYLKHVLVKIDKKESLGVSKRNIRRIEKSFKAISSYRSVRVIYNVDHI